MQASLSVSLLRGADLFAAPKSGANPFTLGVASGDPTPDGIVLWTRLAPDPSNPASLGKKPIPVGWRVALDSRLQNVVGSGVAVAPAR